MVKPRSILGNQSCYIAVTFSESLYALTPTDGLPMTSISSITDDNFILI